jgi:S-adenosylmethionine:tRNA ribosyltransferase-isomerase
MLKVSEFDYVLPLDLIAQRPSPVRDESRLMVLNRQTGEIRHRTFKDITEYLTPSDILVLNDTKVIPARLFGKKKTGGKLEVLLLRRITDNAWEALVNPAKGAGVGVEIDFGDGKLTGKIVDRTDAGTRVIDFKCKGNFWNILSELGETPLPPYIKERGEENFERYQTVYASRDGASAAPTAGLHFTEDLIERIKEKGINVCFITLHTGLATFRPVKEEFVEDHEMYKEYYEISAEAAQKINEVKDKEKGKGGRVVAVGTTTVRALESASTSKGVIPGAEETALFIYPGYQFKVADAIITNFHFPRSTLLMLVSAFANKDLVFKAYEEAIREKYRFYSFGDAMLII